MQPRQRDAFDRILQQVLDELPDACQQVVEQVPVIVEDEPGPELAGEPGIMDDDSELLGLHHGIAMTDRSVEDSGALPDRILVFRGPLLRSCTDDRGRVDQARLAEQIRVTVLHELGHHFGLDEDDLDELGYG